jgi:hypothetical protein
LTATVDNSAQPCTVALSTSKLGQCIAACGAARRGMVHSPSIVQSRSTWLSQLLSRNVWMAASHEHCSGGSCHRPAGDDDCSLSVQLYSLSTAVSSKFARLSSKWRASFRRLRRGRLTWPCEGILCVAVLQQLRDCTPGWYLGCTALKQAMSSS